MTDRLLIRADASALIGAGHVMRCLALAQGWIDCGATAYWLASELLPGFGDRLTAEGIQVAFEDEPATEEQDAARTVRFAQRVAADWVVLDGYAFGALHQVMLNQAGYRVLFVDDNSHAAHYSADIVLNQNMHASDKMYEGKGAGGLFLLGPRYALLRREFRTSPRLAKNMPVTAKNILVTLGGGGNAALAGRIVSALRSVAPARDFQVRLIIGGAVLPSEIDFAGAEGWLRVSQYVDDMPFVLSWADLALSAAGSTVYELMMMGVPSLLVVLTDNQRTIADGLHERGIAVSLGPKEGLTADTISQAVEHLANDQGRRLSLSERGQAAVDGEGASRVRKAMQGGMLRLRSARTEDMRVLWEWANDPDARTASFSNRPIPWEDHVQWFTARLTDARHHIYIAETPQGVAVGTVRFELIGEKAVISASIDYASRGKGYGRWLIRLGSLEILGRLTVHEVLAYIKPANTTSIRAFESAGFRFDSKCIVREQPALLYSFTESRVFAQERA